MTARKRPSAAEPAKAKRGGRSQVEPTPSEAKRKITLYFRVGLLEEARSAVLALGAEGREPSNLSALFGRATGSGGGVAKSSVGTKARCSARRAREG